MEDKIVVEEVETPSEPQNKLDDINTEKVEAPKKCPPNPKLEPTLPTLRDQFYYYNLRIKHFCKTIQDYVQMELVSSPNIWAFNSCFYYEKTDTLPKLRKYVYRLVMESGCKRETIIFALSLIQRLKGGLSNYVTLKTAHLVFLAAFAISNKFIEDFKCPEILYHEIGGVSLKRFKRVESKLLFILEWKLAEEFDFSKIEKKLLRYGNKNKVGEFAKLKNNVRFGINTIDLEDKEEIVEDFVEGEGISKVEVESKTVY